MKKKSIEGVNPRVSGCGGSRRNRLDTYPSIYLYIDMYILIDIEIDIEK